MICESCAARERERRSGVVRSSALLLRVWFEGDGEVPRARLLTADGGDPLTIATAQGVDDICAAVHGWLTRRQDGRT